MDFVYFTTINSIAPMPLLEMYKQRWAPEMGYCDGQENS